MEEEKVFKINIERLHELKGKQCPCLPLGTPNSYKFNCPCDQFTTTGYCRCGIFKIEK